MHVGKSVGVLECVEYEYKNRYNGYASSLGINTNDQAYFFLRDNACNNDDDYGSDDDDYGSIKTSVSKLIDDKILFIDEYDDAITMCDQPTLSAYGKDNITDNIIYFSFEDECEDSNDFLNVNNVQCLKIDNFGYSDWVPWFPFLQDCVDAQSSISKWSATLKFIFFIFPTSIFPLNYCAFR